MKFRTIGLVTTLALGLFTAPTTSVAQEAKKAFRVGVLSTGHPRSAPHWIAFVQELRKLGYVEGQNLAIEFRNAQGQLDRVPSFAAELVRLKADVVVAAGAEATLQAAKQATSTIPIVMVAVDYNPLALGYIGSLSRPGGNVTGVVFQQMELSAKRLELLKETVPQITRIAVFWDAISAGQLAPAEAAAQTLGVTLLPRELRQAPYDFAQAFHDIGHANAEGLMVLMSPLMTKPEQATIPTQAAQHRLPAIYGHSRYAAAGGLLSYGPKLDDIFRRAASYVDRILHRKAPGQLPVERPTTFELVVNLKTAKQLGVTMPSYILYKADKVIR